LVVESFPRDDGQREPKAREERERGSSCVVMVSRLLERPRHSVSPHIIATRWGPRMLRLSPQVNRCAGHVAASGANHASWPPPRVRQGVREEKETSRALGGIATAEPLHQSKGRRAACRRGSDVCTRASQAALDGDITVDLEKTCSSPQCQLATTPRLLHLLRESGHAWDSCG
jgi:hypothetical protein